MEILDITRLMDVSDGDVSFVQDVLAEYEGTVPMLIAAIKNSLASANALDLHCRAHDLKSSSRAVGASQIADLAEKLEQSAKHEAWNESTELLHQIEASWASTQLAVQQVA